MVLAVAALAAVLVPTSSGATGRLVFGPAQRISPGLRDARVLTGISCPSIRLCVAVDSVGEALTSSDPGQADSRWSIATVDRDPQGPHPGGSYLTDISCPSATMCVAVDSSGRVVSSTRPTRGSAAWRATEIDGSRSLRSISCPDRSLCVAVDDDGDVIASTNPSAKRSGWTITHIPGTRDLTSVSCASRRLCVATAAAAHGGTLLVSTQPTAGAHAWSVLTGMSPHAFQSVSCLSEHLCVATDVGGYVTTTTRPLDGRPAWRNAHVDPSPTSRSAGFIIPAVDCPSTTFCLALDDVGKALWSTAPAGGAAEWQLTKRPDNTRAFHDVACPSAKLCVAIDAESLVTIRRPV